MTVTSCLARGYATAQLTTLHPYVVFIVLHHCNLCTRVNRALFAVSAIANDNSKRDNH